MSRIGYMNAMNTFVERLEDIDARYRELGRLLAQPEVAVDYEQVQKLAKERAGLEDTVKGYRELRDLQVQRDEAQSIIDEGDDPEMEALAAEELEEASGRIEGLVEELRLALLPRDPNDERSVIVEIRKGAGGQEAGLFAADLYRMYTRYAHNRAWKVEVLNSNPSDLGGFSEIVFNVDGKNAFGRLKYERGVHRVQRIPDHGVFGAAPHLHSHRGGAAGGGRGGHQDKHGRPAHRRLSCRGTWGPEREQGGHGHPDCP